MDRIYVQLKIIFFYIADITSLPVGDLALGGLLNANDLVAVKEAEWVEGRLDLEG